MTMPKTSDRGADYLASLDCVHCGLCVEHCPTYRHLGRESTNPRGRIYLMRALLEGRATPTPDLVEDLDSCLLCRACESACPSGVQFADVMVATRQKIRKRGFLRKRMMNILLSPRKLSVLATLMRFWQRSPFRAVRHILPKRLREMEAYLPTVPRRAERAPLPATLLPPGTPRGVVALLEGCVMSILFQDVNRDTARLLTAAGYEVRVPQSQGCCGALHEHDGDLDTARAQARQNAAAFDDPSITHVVTNSSGCGAALKGAAHLLPDLPAAQGLSPRVVDMGRFLLDHGDALTFRPAPLRVTYDAPCHLVHVQKEPDGPIRLLSRVPDLTFIPMALADHCCGAAGVYNMDQPVLSQQILNEKLDALAATGAQVLLTGNPGCLLQWRNGVAQRGLDVQVLHPATFFASLLP